VLAALRAERNAKSLNLTEGMDPTTREDFANTEASCVSRGERGIMATSEISLGIATLSVVLTAVYSFFAFKILQVNQRVTTLMEEQLEVATRLYVSIDVITQGSPLLSLRVRNLGSSAARNLTLTLDRDFYRFNQKRDENNLKAAPAFTTPIPSFAPKAELVFDLGVFWAIAREPEMTPIQFQITTAYEYAGKKTNETTYIDLNMFQSSAAHAEPFVEELKAIREALEKIATK